VNTKCHEKFYIGIDVSKKKLDFCLIAANRVILNESICENSLQEIEKALMVLVEKHNLTKTDTIICAEYTGQYTYPLSCACNDLDLILWLENPLQIKMSSGAHRGKNDKADARKIAIYAERFHDRVKPYSIPQKALESLKQLVHERDLYMGDKKKYTVFLEEQKECMNRADYKVKSERLKKIIKELSDSIKEIEEQIKVLINSNEMLSRQNKLLQSIDGIGKRVAVKMIVETGAFTEFTNPQKFCCHAGVTPFEYTSGSSIRSKNRVSNRADKSIKALLHMAALVAAIQMKQGELHDYYIRKVSEGKNKMLVLNAVRAKLVLRMFAVIKRDALYEKNYASCVA